jgi:hydrogenase maturation protein HypF
LSAAAPAVVRTRLVVTGTVQGVGFRPYVYRLAHELALDGWVLNDAHGVVIEVEGPGDAVAELIARLRPEAPPLAIVEQVREVPCSPVSEHGFEIRASPASSGAVDAPVSPDCATCADCLAELRDPGNRRYRYPFINCTNCGPRFTIVRGIPYDRPRTTMAGFKMCADCQAEYDDPRDRRFHAQPNACQVCGPALSLPLEQVVDALRGGAVVALKGIGGYHLACLAADEQAVATLRARKHREDKPFALMVGSLAMAQALVTLDPLETELLCSPQRPIVLAARRADADVAPSVAPHTGELGVMLAYSPLHQLLLDDIGAPLVMTSGNVSDEPIAFADLDARDRLAGTADLLLTHDRPIATQTDDSVLRVARGRVLTLRRSRGYVPGSLSLPVPTEVPLLACGAELKSTFCVAKGQRAWVSHHIGDLHNYETLDSFRTGVEHFQQLFELRPELVVHDLHPEYLSSKYAAERVGVELLGVQHHHAHLAACLAEHGLDPGAQAIGAIFDGTGYGLDQTVWGGEILLGDQAEFERIGHLLPVAMPGGEAAVREPWRMACSWLSAAGAGEAVPDTLHGEVEEHSWSQVRKLAQTGLASPLTTSIGRLFDAVAALCGIRARINYEGQAAIELEAACDRAPGSYRVRVTDSLEIDPREAILAVATEIATGVPVGTVAARFHTGLAEATVTVCTRAAEANGVDMVVLSGGVFLNQRLLTLCADGLDAAGLKVLIPSLLPPGDGGISFGQAAVAAARMHR